MSQQIWVQKYIGKIFKKIILPTFQLEEYNILAIFGKYTLLAGDLYVFSTDQRDWKANWQLSVYNLII